MKKRKKTTTISQPGNIEKALAVLGDTARVASKKPELDIIPTDIYELNDIVLGCGGLPRGRVLEIYAPESVGKSTLCYWLAGQVQKRGGVVVLFDAEGSYVPKYGAQQGIDNDALILPEFTTGNDALFKIKQLIATNSVDLIIVDSVPGLQPKEIKDIKDDEDRNMREKLARANMLTEFSNDLMGGYRIKDTSSTSKKTKYIKNADKKDLHRVHDSKVCLIFINHAKTKIGVMFGDPTNTPGGKALKFLSSIRIGMEYKKKSQEKSETGEPVYKLIYVTAAKNKLAPPLNKIVIQLNTHGSIEYGGPSLEDDDE